VRDLGQEQAMNRSIARSWWLLACLILPAGAAPSLRAQQPASAGARSWTASDVIFQKNAADFRVSPNGYWAVWVSSAMNRETDKRASNLFLSDLQNGQEIQLTRGDDVAVSPRWSPDGKLIAFLFTRKPADAKPGAEEARRQIWLLNADGGEPWPLTHLSRNVDMFEWSGAHSIVYSAEEDPALWEQETHARKDDTRAIENAERTPPVRLFRVNVPDGDVTRLTTNTDWIRDFDVSPDERWAVTVNQQELAYAWDQKTLPKTFLVDLSSGKQKQIFSEGRIAPFLVKFARDGSGIYAVAPYSTSPRFLTATINLVYFYDMAGGSATKIDLHWENALGRGFQVIKGGFIALLADGVRFRPARYVREGGTWRQEFLTGEHDRNIFGFELGPDDRTLVYEYTTASMPPQWFRATLDGASIGKPLQITNLNPSFKDKVISKTEIIHWKGALDETVDGVLYYPHNYQPGHRYPLLLMIHGGPTGYDIDGWEQSWAYPMQLYTERGAFALKVNYHGSGNYGLKWAESICCGKYYTLEVPDMEKGVDALIAKGLVDPNQVATMGWSNGAILSIALAIEDPDRYKVLSEGAGDVEWISDWANVDFGESFDAYYFGANPIQNPQLYVKESPFFRISRLKAPTIIFQGMEDRNVPTDQSWDLYRAIYWTNKVPYRFFLFPGEPHGPQKATHQMRKVDEELAWFEKYFFHSGPPPSEAVKHGSLLDAMIDSRHAGRNYGVEFQNVLIPQVVTHGLLEVGRFEVTRAQFAAFDPHYAVAPGTENYPANDISFEQAKAYCAWLSKLTGETYRLPTEAEGKKLYQPSTKDNTLDYWTGYPINPDDMLRLDSMLDTLAPGALLRQAGSFPGVAGQGEQDVYDLGGNVAEWVAEPRGTGKTEGGSADRPADPKAHYRAADASYTGFRVVRAARP
jgi:dipeptidyl aminopeptidase/acylaminoacyl peptidase/formylglycine-generating enzyme required for sulfatase activity